MKKKALNVGCGNFPIESWICDPGAWEETRVDINPAVAPDIVASAMDLGKIKTGSYDLVYNSHNLEHVYAHEVPVVLRGFRRVLKKGGEVVITCPDIQSVAASIAEGNLEGVLYLANDIPISPIDIVYGHRGEIALGNEFFAHKTAFTDATLAAKLLHAGFKNVKVDRYIKEFVLWARATK
jgi:ubiquinone/menaquinone biosynthesis C-methylase UbiE